MDLGGIVVGLISACQCWQWMIQPSLSGFNRNTKCIYVSFYQPSFLFAILEKPNRCAMELSDVWASSELSMPFPFHMCIMWWIWRALTSQLLWRSPSPFFISSLHMYWCSPSPWAEPSLWWQMDAQPLRGQRAAPHPTGRPLGQGDVSGSLHLLSGMASTCCRHQCAKHRLACWSSHYQLLTVVLGG